MRHCLIVVAVSFLAATAWAADAEDTPATRRVAAERYARVSDVPKLLRQLVEGMAPNLPLDQREQFRTLMLQNVRADFVETAMIVAMTKHFTTAELNALADFYGSEIGKSAMAKFGAYMGDTMPLMQAEMIRAMGEYQKQRAKSSQSGM